jgi:hypothetical protein
VIALVQQYAPELTDGLWLARVRAPGRASANLDQPNHLATLLAWGWLAALWLRERVVARAPRWAFDALALALAASIASTTSRSAALAVILLVLWALADRRWSAALRWRLVVGAAVMAIAWIGRAAWGAQLLAQGWSATVARPSARGGIYADAVQLIAQHPLAGVGWGEFQLAWTMTPFGDRGPRYFDHAHNIALQLAAELGVVLGGAVLALLAWALARAWRAARRQLPGAEQRLLVLAMLLVVTCHALFEAPWWYAYFLMPTAWLWGWLLGAAAGIDAAGASSRASRGAGAGSGSGIGPAVGPSSATAAAPDRPAGARPLLLTGLALSCAAFLIWADFLRVLPAALPASHPMPLDERLAAARASRLFAYYADFRQAVAVGAQAPPATFRRARLAALDVELLMPWSEALARAGELDAARHLGERVREFGDPRARAWLAACEHTPAPPVRCGTPARTFTWREFQ